MRKSILSLITLLILFAFKTKHESNLKFIHIKGTAINLYTKKPLKKNEIIFDDEKINPGSYKKVKTNSKGEFVIDDAIDKNKLEFWLSSGEFAQINFINPKIIPGKWRDTINLDTVYFVPYFNELKQEFYNFPNNRKEKPNQNCYTLKEIDSIFSKYERLYNMKINSIDTIDLGMLRIGYYYKKSLFHKKESKRGTIVSSYKTLTLIRDLK
ncbi:hypothetical protein [Flavobacterium suncheonense]|uniref:Uncharacterized protein n=1 Tax=Flavobacterium suncheonense GH29-5 = DSM 17707 TaxID=1121899 RepID=A0A0A2M2K3_9FLAO|nr:hypothetical protein [Flavobacterium suncheonense]KGO85648.1 hypothetical protein Q764_13985 [Flavobacterium suncheonense GH29-5 = DSM 17707]